MKTLADQIVAAMGTDGISLAAVMKRLACDRVSAMAAFRKLDEAKRAKVCRRLSSGRPFWLLPLDDTRAVCVVCKGEFARPIYADGSTSKRVTCARSCQAALTWADPESTRKRMINLIASKRTPEARAKQAETNKKRWADPEQHKRLSEWSKKRWADEETKARMSAGIRNVNQTPEMRKLFSEIRKKHWADPVKRKKMYDAATKSQRTQEYRKTFSEHLKKRWEDPVLRAKYTEANKRRNADPKFKAATSARMKAYHAARRAAKAQEQVSP